MREPIYIHILTAANAGIVLNLLALLVHKYKYGHLRRRVSGHRVGDSFYELLLYEALSY